MGGDGAITLVWTVRQRWCRTGGGGRSAVLEKWGGEKSGMLMNDNDGIVDV